MMARFSLGARLTTIVIVTLLAVWLLTLMVAYKARFDGPEVLPAPGQIAAIASLVEATTLGERSRLLAAVSSPSVEISLRPGRALDGDLVTRLADEPLYDGLEELLGGRPFGLAQVWGEGLLRRAAGGGGFRPGVRIEVALATGEIMTIIARSPPGITRLGLPVGVAAGLFGTLIALIALLMLNRETRPIARLAAVVDSMTLDGAPVSLPHSRWSAPEIEALAAAFERLQGRLGQLIRARMAMLGGISHDVRTFATRLRLRVEGIADDNARERAVADISDMIRLLDDALLASRSGAGELAEELLDFEEIVRSEIEDRKAVDAPVTLEVDATAAKVPVIGDRLALRRIVANLVDNAVKYGERATVRLDRDGRSLRLIVDDDGPGIAVADREALLEPFVRLEASRNRTTGGAGLGLAIVRSLVDAHGGSIAIGEAAGGGARFTVTLPVFEAG